MKNKLSKKQVEEKIANFFRQTGELDPRNIKKTKRLAMSYNLKLKDYRKRFCKKCFSDLKYNKGKIRVGKMYKTIECAKCGFLNRWKVNSS